MTMTWPLPVSDFWDQLPLSSSTFHLPGDLSVTITEDGDVIPSRRGRRLWQGAVTLGRDYHAKNAEIEALVEALMEPGASFMIYDRRKPYPAADPDGTLLGGATPTLFSLDPNNRRVSIAGLPAGYTLTRGDRIGWTYGADPVRHALHRVVTTVTADGAGFTPDFEVRPFIRPGTQAGADVTLIRPLCRAKLIEEEIGASNARLSSAGSFRWMQTLR